MMQGSASGSCGGMMSMMAGLDDENGQGMMGPDATQELHLSPF